LKNQAFFLISNMSSPNQKPDLDDSVNVSITHGRVVREAAACAREKRIVENGIGHVSLWAFAACGVILLIAGGILANGGELFSYSASFRPGYKRAVAPGLDDAGPVAKEAMAAFSAKGAKIFSAKCAGCHGSDAKGNGSTYPSLVGSAWVKGETERFAMVILNGLQGPVSNGQVYGVMPAQGVGMSPEDLAGIMTYMRNNYGNTVNDVVNLDMAKKAIEVSAARAKAGNAVTAEELTASHVKPLVGTMIDPKAMVDPVTLIPVTAP
jgi:mono/diheme cytochrome c family protein